MNGHLLFSSFLMLLSLTANIEANIVGEFVVTSGETKLIHRKSLSEISDDNGPLTSSSQGDNLNGKEENTTTTNRPSSTTILNNDQGEKESKVQIVLSKPVLKQNSSVATIINEVEASFENESQTENQKPNSSSVPLNISTSTTIPETTPFEADENILDPRLHYIIEEIKLDSNDPIILKPKTSYERKHLSELFTIPSFAKSNYAPNAETQEDRNNLIQSLRDTEHFDAIELSRLELLKRRLNAMRMQQMLPDIHSKNKLAKDQVGPIVMGVPIAEVVTKEIEQSKGSSWWPFNLWGSEKGKSNIGETWTTKFQNPVAPVNQKNLSIPEPIEMIQQIPVRYSFNIPS